jgi:hypothetical protein
VSWFGDVFPAHWGVADFIFAQKHHHEWLAVSRSPGGAPAALHGYPWMLSFSTGRRALPRLKAHKGIPGAAGLPGDRLARQCLDLNPIENCWNYLKNMLKKKDNSSVPKLI